MDLDNSILTDKETQLWLKYKDQVFFPENLYHELDQKSFLYWLKRVSVCGAGAQVHMTMYDRQRDEYDKVGIYCDLSDNTGDELFIPYVKLGSRPFLFLDRDGVINEDDGYIFKKENIKWRPHVFSALKHLCDHGVGIVVVTNQSGVGRGYYTEQDVLDLHGWMHRELLSHGVTIDAWYYCPYHPQAVESHYKKQSPLRKPNSAMLEMAFADHDIDPEKSLMVGDKMSDEFKGFDLETWFMRGNYELDSARKIITSLQDVVSYYSCE